MARSMADYLATFNAYGKAKQASDADPLGGNPFVTAPAQLDKPPIMDLYKTPESRVGYFDAMASSMSASKGGTAGAGPATDKIPKTDTTGGVAGMGGTVPGGFNWNDLQGMAGSAYTQLMDTLNKPFTYDYANDSSYKAAMELAKADASDASKHTLEIMNDRGLANSSYTTSQIGQIEQKARLEPLKLVPQLQGQAMQERNTKLQTLYNLFSGELSAGLQKSQFDQTLPLQKAAVTGKYTDDKVQGLVDTIMGAKRDWAGAPTKQAKDTLAKSAADARTMLTSMGYDAEKLFGGNVGLAAAGKNAAGLGQLTAPSQAALLNAFTTTAQATGQWPKNTGNMFADMPLFDGLAPVFKGMEGQKTMDYRKFEAEMAKIGLQMQGEKLSQAAQAQNKSYTEWLHANNMSEAEAKQQTNLFVLDLTSKAYEKDKDGKLWDREAMFKYVNDNRDNLAHKGILLQDVITAINSTSFGNNKEGGGLGGPYNPWETPPKKLPE